MYNSLKKRRHSEEMNKVVFLLNNYNFDENLLTVGNPGTLEGFDSFFFYGASSLHGFFSHSLQDVFFQITCTIKPVLTTTFGQRPPVNNGQPKTGYIKLRNNFHWKA